MNDENRQRDETPRALEVIINPRSGTSDKEGVRERLAELFQQNGIEARISLAQSMGSEVIAHFDPAGGSVQTEDVLAFTGEQDDVAGRDQLASAHQLIGRFDPRTKAEAGSTMTVSLDLERIHFFDPETELAV